MQPERREIKFGPVRISQELSRVLLVFPVEDGQSEAFMWACRKGGFMCSIVNTQEQVLEALEKRKHHIVVIDMRLPVNSTGEQICKKIRSVCGHQNTVLLAVSPAIPRWCEELSVVPYLEMGFNRRFLENHDRGACLNEIVMIDSNEIRSNFKLSLAYTLLQLIDESKDSVDITDTDGICTYVNQAFEKLTGFTKAEIVGNSTKALINEEKTCRDVPESMRRSMDEGRHWEGVIYNNRKSAEPVPVDLKIFPVLEDTPHSGALYFVTLRQDPSSGCKYCSYKSNSSRRMSNGRIRTESSNTSINSIPLGSTTSRRLSKQIDAPIIKILTMLRAIQDSAPSLPPNLIENITAMLRSSELYNPGSNSLTEDPEAIGFMDGLMEGRGTRLSISGDAALLSHRESAVGIGNAITSHVVPEEVKANLSHRKEWSYDIFQLERLTNRKPLLCIGFEILVEFGILNLFKIGESTLKHWLTAIESQYRPSNSYHNSTHAADVLQASAYYCRNKVMQKCLDALDFLALLIASICHDIDHPGRTNAFLCNVNHKLATLYNDSAVLESHHAAHTFKLTCQGEQSKTINIFQNLSSDVFKMMRKSIISMILATDMTQHFDHYNKFLAVIKPLNDTEQGDPASMGFPLNPDHKSLILRMAIKCSDISNQSRPQVLAKEWAHRIVLEYREQISEERRKELPPSLPSFDDIPKSQVYFIHIFANDLLGAFYEFLEMDNLIETMKQTFDYWDSFTDTNPYLDDPDK